jgi:cell division protein FtsB
VLQGGRTRPQGIRWDRVGRVALLVVLIGVVALAVGPAINLLSTWQEANARNAQVERLERENAKLRARKQALNDEATLEREARRLGFVKPGERPYVVRGLPED